MYKRMKAASSAMLLNAGTTQHPKDPKSSDTLADGDMFGC